MKKNKKKLKKVKKNKKIEASMKKNKTTIIKEIKTPIKEIATPKIETIIQAAPIIKKDVTTTYVSKYMSIHKDKEDFIDEIKSLKEKELLSENSFQHLKELIIKLSMEDNFIDTPEQKMIELEISNRRILDWQKGRFDSKKDNLKEKTKLRISTLFEDYDDYMWKGKLASFSELKFLSKTLAKKI